MAETQCPKCSAPVDVTTDEYGMHFHYTMEQETSSLYDMLVEETLPVEIKPLDNFVGLPKYATPESSGCDILAAISQPIYLQPKQVELIPSGFAMSLPHGYEAQIRPRSSKPKKKGITVANAPGTIDADFTGEVKVMLYNMTDEVVEVEPNEAIAQMIIAPTFQANWKIVEELETTERGSGGFGSTGN